MKLECDIDKLMDAIIDVSHIGVSTEIVIRSILKNMARMHCDIEDIREEFEEFKQHYLNSKEEDNQDDDE